MAKNKPEDYKAIAIWGRRMQSFEPYVKRQQELAAEENAPLDATFQRSPGDWATVSGMGNAELKAEIEAELERGK